MMSFAQIIRRMKANDGTASAPSPSISYRFVILLLNIDERINRSMLTPVYLNEREMRVASSCVWKVVTRSRAAKS